MSSPLRSPLLAALLVILATGCTSIPRSGMPVSQFSSLDCAQIADQLQQAQATQQSAAAAKGNAWKAVLPPLIGARYIRASSRETEAESRKATLLSEQQSKQCAARSS